MSTPTHTSKAQSTDGRIAVAATATAPKSRASRSSSRPVPDDPHGPEMIVRAWPHVREMLDRRGYAVGNAMEPSISEAKARKTPLFRLVPPQTQESIDAALATAHTAGLRRARVNRPRGSILVVFTGVPKVNVGTIREVITRMARAVSGETPWRALVLSCHGNTTQVPGEIEKSIAPHQHVELATYDQHFFCPADHRLVPPHDVLSPQQKAALLARLGLVDDTLLPRQLRTDAISRYYGLDPGDIVYYRRPLGTLETTHSYRVVVDTPPA